MSELNGSRTGAIIKFMVFIVLCVGGYIGYQKFTESNRRISELTRLRSIYSNGKWQETIDGYNAYWRKYPDKEEQGREDVGESYQHLADGLYQAAIRKSDRLKDLKEASALFEEAMGYGKLSESSLFALCDCYIEMKEFDKAAGVVREAKERDDVNDHRFFIYDKYVKRNQSD